MQRYIFRVDGRPADRKAVDAADVDEARNEAVRYLASILQHSPNFAHEGHWTVHVDDSDGRCLLHVVVATVAAANGTIGR